MTFSEKVYKFTSLVPRGKVATYSALAAAIGSPRAVRAVGNALNKNPFAPKVPCHRIIRSSGEIGGFAGGCAKKTRLLKIEGVIVRAGRVSLRDYAYDFRT